MNYRFHPAAEAEHLEQIVFYESRQQGLGSRYRTHFLRTVERICEAPRNTRWSIRPIFGARGCASSP
jgi:toxin ParE1/3/4